MPKSCNPKPEAPQRFHVIWERAMLTPCLARNPKGPKDPIIRCSFSDSRYVGLGFGRVYDYSVLGPLGKPFSFAFANKLPRCWYHHQEPLRYLSRSSAYDVPHRPNVNSPNQILEDNVNWTLDPSLWKCTLKACLKFWV